jgi:HPt (histidine-containing phosphotransfer) domain-containing protein
MPHEDVGRSAAAEFDAESTAERTGVSLDTLCELVGVFLEQTPRLIADAHDALSRGDSQALRLAAHTLKGSTQVFSAARATSAAMRLEALALEESLVDAPAALAALESDLQRLSAELEAFAGAHAGCKNE